MQELVAVDGDCEAGGTASVDGDIANDQGLTPGDSLTLTFVDCNDGATTVDGTLVLTVTQLEGDFASGMYALTISLELTGFSVVEEGETVTAEGDVSLSIDLQQPPLVSATITSSSLTIGNGSESYSLADFEVARTTDETTGGYTVEASGRVTSSTFGGAVTFETVQTLEGLGAERPTSGELLVTGAEGATLRVIVLSGGTGVRLELDEDGDGVVDVTRDRAWDELT